MNERTFTFRCSTIPAAILGQVIKADEDPGWTGFDYVADDGKGTRIGYFDTAEVAKQAVDLSVEASLKEKKSL